MSDPDGPYRGWLYATQGDYHRNLDPDWSYTPTYLAKLDAARKLIATLPEGARVLDAGCGEGILVDEYRRRGLDIEGLDLNYESAFVRRGDVRSMPFPDASFDLVLLLDVLEHLEFRDQPRALAEVHRTLRPGGLLALSTPNLAHLNARFKLLFCGHLDRADSELEHPGERPMEEYRRLLASAGFRIVRIRGVTLTMPWVYRDLICRHAARLRWLHDALEPAARLIPSLALVTMFTCRKPESVDKSEGG